MENVTVTNSKIPSIGAILSYVQTDITVQDKKRFLKYPEMEKYYNHLKNRCNELKSNMPLVNKIYNNVPKHSCSAQNPFLKDNVDFFIAYSILSEQQIIDINNADKFIHHLNNCYWCFILFNQFVNDEYFTHKELESSKTGD